ncbi:MAG: aminotransferase class I/II-fold pyridoxal phosphate-dependent enzyme [Chitinispirillales bacterium]|jgi:aspartate/methionine/tyrosine aminotransferase|nr:aminotransferase class I/II-fold pyridoxal phosphate-dependent enzyme [Chitinispirillales bacterium]
MKLRLNIDFEKEKFLMFVMDDMANRFEAEGRDVIRMTLGKSELPLHPDIVGAMQKASGDFKSYTQVFPAGLPELKAELSEYYKLKYGVTAEPQNFIISTGTSALFRNLFHLLLSRDDEALIPLPYYSLYHFCALLMGAKVRYYKIDPKTLRIDFNSFERNFTDKTRVVVINSPGNPLGNILTKEELYKIDGVVNGQAAVINDEIYANVCFDNDGISVMQLRDTKSVFITTDAFSKGYRMYSKRVGYCIVPNELVTPLTVIQHHTLLTVDPVVQYGAIAALKHQDDIKTLCGLYKERRDYTVKKLGDIPGVNPVYSQGGFYITIDCEEYMKNRNIATSLELAQKIMESECVAAVPGSDFGLPYTLRLSFSSLKYNEGIDRLVKFFSLY